MKPVSPSRRDPHRAVATAIAGALLLGACASTPPAPTAALQAAQQAIATAERADAGRYAPAELGEARSKLASADAAVTDRKMLVATRYAEQSRAEAELASARTSSAKANAVNDEMKRSNGALVEEIQRKSGATP
jgi:hypothetical protein